MQPKNPGSFDPSCSLGLIKLMLLDSLCYREQRGVDDFIQKALQRLVDQLTVVISTKRPIDVPNESISIPPTINKRSLKREPIKFGKFSQLNKLIRIIHIHIHLKKNLFSILNNLSNIYTQNIQKKQFHFSYQYHCHNLKLLYKILLLISNSRKSATSCNIAMIAAEKFRKRIPQCFPKTKAINFEKSYMRISD